jgi:putative acetyltransferase
MIIRPESPADIAFIRDVHQQAFGGGQEAMVVDALRSDGSAILSLVAEDGDRIAGHVTFSRMDAPFPALGLAPVGVLPARQRTGIGSALIRHGIASATEEGWEAIFVVGDPNYYLRFGFDAGMASGFESPYAGPYLMALPLTAHGLVVRRGRIAYAPAFAGLS